MTSEAKRTNSMKKFLRAVVLAAVWIGCGHIARGYWIGEFTTKYPDQEQERFATVNYVVGPSALFVTVISGGLAFPYMPHGYTCQQRYDAFKRDSAILGKDYFVHYGGNQLCKVEGLQ